MNDISILSTNVNSYTKQQHKQDRSLNFSDLQAYGYTVDKAGFMGADFNKAAGLPQDFKIHKSTLDAIVLHNQKHPNFTNFSMNTKKVVLYSNLETFIEEDNEFAGLIVLCHKN